MELGASEPVPAFNAPAVPHLLQLRFWRDAQADEKEVALEGGLADTLAADDQFDDPAAARPGLGDEVRSLFGPELSKWRTARDRALKKCSERGVEGVPDNQL